MSMSTTILSDGAPDRYVDRKRYLWVLSVVWPAAPLIGLYLVHLTGWSIFYAFTLFVWYGAIPVFDVLFGKDPNNRSEEHTSELQSLMRISYAVFCLKKKNRHLYTTNVYSNILK